MYGKWLIYLFIETKKTLQTWDWWYSPLSLSSYKSRLFISLSLFRGCSFIAVTIWRVYYLFYRTQTSLKHYNPRTLLRTETFTMPIDTGWNCKFQKLKSQIDIRYLVKSVLYLINVQMLVSKDDTTVIPFLWCNIILTLL